MTSLGLPAWQTGELDEEWIESSPSPPTTLAALPPVPPAESLIPPNPTSVKAKRGSLRALGHSAPRGLPPSRNFSSQLSPGGQGTVDRVLSEKIGSTNGSTGPLNGRTWSGSANGPVAGTFVVKDGVEDDRGAHLARNGFAPGKKDMFGPSALEKMFQPPSPPTQTAVASNPSPGTTNVTQPPVNQAVRRLSHAYAPINPSRLSKSVTPSTASGSTSTSMTLEQQPDQTMFADETAEGDADTQAGERTDNEQHLKPSPMMAEHTEQDNVRASPIQAKEGYPFTFSSSYRSSQNPTLGKKPVFDPSLSPFATGEPSHSTLHGPSGKSKARGGLHLFRSTYDTYTREHLSALVDSIAIESSPSPPGGSPREDDCVWSPEHGPMGEDHSGPSSGSRTRSTDMSDDSRSSKRMRMSPTSPARQAVGVRDWDAQARAVMDKIRGREVESTTSASMSASPEKDDVYYERQSDEEIERPPTPPLVSAPSRPTHRSNPSTTSSGYLRAAEDIMAKIKARKVSDSSAAPEISAGSIGGRVNSASSSEWDIAAIAAQSLRAKGKARAVESSRNIFRPVEATDTVQSNGSSSNKARLEPRRPGSASSVTANGESQVNNDDLNRFVSATTAATATTMSTSFVKHPGPRGYPQGARMRMIKPDDVLGLVRDKVGKMRYDKASMKWVRDGLDKVDEAGESRASRSRSEGSEDVFAGMDSWNDNPPSAGRTAVPLPLPEHVEGNDLSESESSASGDDIVQVQTQVTQVIDADVDSPSDSDSDIDHPVDTAPAPVSPPPRLASALDDFPPITTPTPAASAPQPIRSALRNPNGAVATPAALKKRTAWHESVTPAVAAVSARRSVSFSDGKKAGRIAGLHSEDDINVGVFEGRNGLANETQKRIAAMLGEMGAMTIGGDTPSKLPHGALHMSPGSGDSEDDRTIQPIRSFQSRMAANATFLTECSFGVAHDNLVKIITDVYGAEPWWEHLTTLDLRGKGADSVARLKEFLPDLDEVNLDDNKISYLSGVPSGVRTLHVARNRLTSLTSLDHLRNLQYLDVSGNKLDSVSQLQCLRHLRELKADKNSIRDLEGVLQMDCLIKFSACDNKIQRLDLSTAKWQHLESLNLSNNQITEVKCLERLSVISTLNLENNDIVRLQTDTPMPSIVNLRVSENRLTSLDLSLFPKVRTVYADRNELQDIARTLGGTSRVENLSLRNQRVAGLFLRRMDLESVKRLYVSGNPLSSDFLPSSPLYALIYLEAAGCTLSSWPEQFAHRLPNIKILNVNYNFLQNLDGLKGLHGLRKLTAVGNRLGDGPAKGVAEGLRGLTSLEEIDLRSNPSTLGFYLPLLLPNTSQPVTAILDPSSPPPPPRQAPLPSVTLATIHPSSLKNEPAATPAPIAWASLDSQFRKSLPDEWYSKRLVYQGLIMLNCPKLRSLDGLRVEQNERRKAEMLLDVMRSRAGTTDQ